MLPMPHGVIVPGGRFREAYYWDSYWVVLGLLSVGMFETARGLTEVPPPPHCHHATAAALRAAPGTPTPCAVSTSPETVRGYAHYARLVWRIWVAA